MSAPGAAPEADVPYALSGYGLAKSENVPNLKPCEQGPSPIRPGGESRACRIRQDTRSTGSDLGAEVGLLIAKSKQRTANRKELVAKSKGPRVDGAHERLV